MFARMVVVDQNMKVSPGLQVNRRFYMQANEKKMFVGELTQEQKFQILIETLKQRYEAAHKIRERSMQFSVWLFGYAILLIWAMVTECSPSLTQKILLASMSMVIFGASAWFIHSLDKGFDNNRDVMITCEKILGLYDVGCFSEGESVLPPSYAKCGRKAVNHFCTLEIMMVILGILVFFAILAA